VAAVVAIALPLPGCKKSVNTVPVSGKVTVDGEPLTSGQVAFVPVDEGAPKELSSATIDAKGNYSIKTAGKDGAPPGKYKVTVSMMMTPTGDGKAPELPFPTKYGNPRDTPLSVEVVANAPAGAYDLKIESGKKK